MGPSRTHDDRAQLTFFCSVGLVCAPLSSWPWLSHYPFQEPLTFPVPIFLTFLPLTHFLDNLADTTEVEHLDIAFELQIGIIFHQASVKCVLLKEFRR